ncbi:hypothetical protein [Actinokineospora sp. NBRC 105648]|uniref:hypothetical protein n=1 Tax=Actinokineospora sp. NBRC 105648 TaxID=3032206 RepID=UPI00249FF333|nr:hypothetical protein [Actinokineospora sp. NBRC 105648]GLZ42474.1 hypothetical protein Acsp05_60980 [Actinokineospora sp. NBRC 105648]
MYSIRIFNDSPLDGQNAIVFQQPLATAPVSVLAWHSRMCHPDTRVRFEWTVRHCFVWGHAGELRPGVDYDAGQEVPADLDSRNEITLDYPDGGFVFTDQADGLHEALTVRESAAVPGNGNPRRGCVGIGMDGAGTAVLPTTPHDWVQFTPTPAYWVAFGRFGPGTVLPPDGLVVPQEIDFPVTTGTADCVFDGDKWTVHYW